MSKDLLMASVAVQPLRGAIHDMMRTLLFRVGRSLGKSQAAAEMMKRQGTQLAMLLKNGSVVTFSKQRLA